MRMCSHLNWVLICQEVDDLKRMRNDADSHQFLSIVSTFHHEPALQRTTAPQYRLVETPKKSERNARVD
jgi:hypothetical protein